VHRDGVGADASILQAYREVWPALKRQLRYEDWFIKRELPPTAEPYRPEFHGDIVPTPAFAAA
jgi:fatty acid desaturase